MIDIIYNLACNRGTALEVAISKLIDLLYSDTSLLNFMDGVSFLIKSFIITDRFIPY